MSIQLGELEEPDSVEWIAILPGRRNKANDSRGFFIYLSSFFENYIVLLSLLPMPRTESNKKEKIFPSELK